jgi:hypothetical protein
VKAGASLLFLHAVVVMSARDNKPKSTFFIVTIGFFRVMNYNSAAKIN